MKSIYCLFTIFCVINAREIFENNPNMPIKEIRTNYGEGDHERVLYLRAVIEPKHINERDRINFPTTGYLDTYFKEMKAEGDERGHLVASQFSGPATWYNLSPQNPRVNRNAGYQSITTDWYGTECEVRNFLDQRGARSVVWEVTMTYVGKSNRPSTYHLQVTFYDGNNRVDAIDSHIQNPFLNQDKEFYICRACRTSRHQKDECVRAKA